MDADAKSKKPNIETDLNEDHEIEHERPVLDSELEFTHMAPAEQDYLSSEGPHDIPEDTESSDGQALGFEEGSDGDSEKDEDYQMESDDGDNRSNLDSDGDFYLREDHEPPKKAGKVIAAKVRCYFIRLYVLGFGDNKSETH